MRDRLPAGCGEEAVGTRGRNRLRVEGGPVVDEPRAGSVVDEARAGGGQPRSRLAAIFADSAKMSMKPCAFDWSKVSPES